MSVRTLARLGAPTAALALALGVAGPASAHVTVTAAETAAGSYTVLTVSVPHGCDGSPTTELAVQIPEGINAVTPTRNPFYDVEVQLETLDQPITDAHGNEITERVDQVVYTATTPLPDGERDTFELSLQLPDAPGETLVFPAVQTCEQGETAWTEVAAEGAEEPEHPAPTVTVTEPAVADAGTEDGTEDGTGTALGVAGLVAGLLGLAAGVTALVTGRRKA